MTSLKIKLAGLALAFMLPLTAVARAEDMGIDDPQRDAYYEALKGKKVVFVPLALGFDLTDGWYASLKNQLEPLGVSVDVRDPNWSTDAGSRAITSLIAEKPTPSLSTIPTFRPMPSCCARQSKPAFVSFRST